VLIIAKIGAFGIGYSPAAFSTSLPEDSTLGQILSPQPPIVDHQEQMFPVQPRHQNTQCAAWLGRQRQAPESAQCTMQFNMQAVTRL
jgi:hypothetical protein